MNFDLSIIWESLSKLILVFLLYTYLLYIVFFKEGKFVSIKTIEEAGKLMLLFLGFFILVTPMITGIIFMGNIMFGIPLPTDLTSDMEGIIFSLLAFVFLPYMVKWDAEKRGKKFDIGDWFFLILLINLWIIIFSTINSIYTKIFVSDPVSLSFLGVTLFLGIIFLLSFAYLKVVLTSIFKLKKRKYFSKKSWELIAIQIITSIIGLFIHLKFL